MAFKKETRIRFYSRVEKKKQEFEVPNTLDKAKFLVKKEK